MTDITFDNMPKVLGVLMGKIDYLTKIVSDIKEKNHEDEDIPIRIQEAASLTGLSVPTLYTYVNRGLIPAMRAEGTKKLYFSKSDLIGFIRSGRRKTLKEIEAETNTYIN